MINKHLSVVSDRILVHLKCYVLCYLLIKLANRTYELVIGMVEILDLLVLMSLAAEHRARLAQADGARAANGHALVADGHLPNDLDHAVHLNDVDFLPCTTGRACQ